MKYVLILMLSINVFAFSPTTGNMSGNKEIENYKNHNQKEKFSYSEMISFLKNSKNKNKLMILGVLYAQRSDKPDDYGVYIEADPALSLKYIMKSYHMGNKEALVILAGLILYNDNMAKLDMNLDKTKNILIKAKNENTKSAEFMLALVELLRKEYEIGVKDMVIAAENGDASAQLEAALIFQKGIAKSKNSKEYIIKPQRDLSEYYLNKACTNENKSDKITEFCNSSLIKSQIN